MALENHDRFTTHDFLHILEIINSPYLGICLDTVNSFGALEGPEVVITALAPWTVNLHVKDFIIRRADHLMGFTIEGTPAGRGHLNIPSILEELVKHGRSPNAIIELWTPPETSLDETIAKEHCWAQESVRNLRAFIQDDA